jgi:putative endonuclease
MKKWNIYIVRCSDNSLYTGITVDVKRRLCEHASSKRGAKYLQGKGPLKLVLSRIVGEKSDALRLESCVKKLTKEKKELLILNHRQLKNFMSDSTGTSL